MGVSTPQTLLNKWIVYLLILFRQGVTTKLEQQLGEYLVVLNRTYPYSRKDYAYG